MKTYKRYAIETVVDADSVSGVRPVLIEGEFNSSVVVSLIQGKWVRPFSTPEKAWEGFVAEKSIAAKYYQKGLTREISLRDEAQRQLDELRGKPE